MSHRPALLSAEAAYLGSLLWLDTQQAREAHSWLTETDIGSPPLQLVHRLVGELTAAGIGPDPVVVYELARFRDDVVGEHQSHAFTNHLLQLFDHRTTVPASVRCYAVAALEDAVRRRTAAMATRLAQVADHADLDELRRLTQAEQAAVDAIHARRGTLAAIEGAVLAA
jgi:replicative DNA helicase